MMLESGNAVGFVLKREKETDVAVAVVVGVVAAEAPIVDDGLPGTVAGGVALA
jgi:hypothetical protein